MTKNPAILLALLTIALWGFGPLLSRLISLKSALLLLSVSYLFSLVTLILYFRHKFKRQFWDMFRLLTLKDIFFGPFGYCLYSLAFILSLRAFSSASEATILNYTWPVFTVIFSETFFRAKARKAGARYVVESTGIGLGLLAVAILATKGSLANLHTLNVKGVGWGLLTGISYGLFSAYSGTVPMERQGVFLISAVATSLLVMALASLKDIAAVSAFTFQDLLVVFALGSLLNGVGYVTWTTAIRKVRESNINVSSIASMMFVLPVLSLIIIAIVLKEKELFEPYVIMSLFLVTASSVICQKAGTLAEHARQKSACASCRTVDCSSATGMGGGKDTTTHEK